MKTNLLSLGLLPFATLAITLGACASSSASDALTGSSASPATAAQAAPAADLAGTWGFDLASSDVAAPLRARCAKNSHDDPAKTQACWNEVATQAAMEKIRFANDVTGHTVWTSFESDGSKESVYVTVPVELAADGPGHVLCKVSGEPKGEHAAQFAKSNINVMRIEVVDARTIAMTDPKKGRLVYSKE
jgi:hypothetical protein